MNILVLYHFYNQRALMHNFAERLNAYDIFIDTLCVDNFCYEQNSNIKWPCFLTKMFDSLRSMKKGTLYRVIRMVNGVILKKTLLSMYETVDFHAYYPSYNTYMCYCKKHNIKFDITLWGSDILRSSSKTKKKLRFGFDNCYRIKSAENLYDAFVKTYGNVYDSKYRKVFFGSSEMVNIDSLSDKDARNIVKRLYGETGNRKIVVCGYNGGRVQNHGIMINALNQLREDEKKMIYAVFPMTYNSPPEYIKEIKTALEATSIPYTILDSFLEVQEVAAIRKTADIFLFTQETDAASDSPKGHLYCENVCIIGDWIDYGFYEKSNIFFIKTSKEGLLAQLQDVLSHYPRYHALFNGNRDKLKELFSWETTILKQVSVYGE